MPLSRECNRVASLTNQVSGSGTMIEPPRTHNTLHQIVSDGNARILLLCDWSSSQPAAGRFTCSTTMPSHTRETKRNPRRRARETSRPKNPTGGNRENRGSSPSPFPLLPPVQTARGSLANAERQSDAGGPARPHRQLTWPARVRSSDLVGPIFLCCRQRPGLCHHV